MTSVVLCGSRRFKAEIRQIGRELREAGLDVYEPHLHHSPPEEWAALREDHRNYILLGLTLDHFRKIEMADVMYVCNFDGYVGVSTTMEIGYAAALKKPIYAHSEADPEGTRRCLYRSYATTTADLVRILGSR